MKVESGGLVAFAITVRAGDIEVGEELHLDFFEAVPGAAVTAAGPGVKGKEAGGEIEGLRFGGEGEKLADGIEGTEKDRWGGARGAGDGGLIDELDA